MLDRDLQHSDISAIERTGSPLQPHIKPTFRADELIQVVEISDEEYAEIVINRNGKMKG